MNEFDVDADRADEIRAKVERFRAVSGTWSKVMAGGFALMGLAFLATIIWGCMAAHAISWRSTFIITALCMPLGSLVVVVGAFRISSVGYCPFCGQGNRKYPVDRVHCTHCGNTYEE